MFLFKFTQKKCKHQRQKNNCLWWLEEDWNTEMVGRLRFERRTNRLKVNGSRKQGL